MLWLMRGISSGSGQFVIEISPLSVETFVIDGSTIIQGTHWTVWYIWHACLEEAVVCIICISWQHWDNGFLLALVIYNIMCWIYYSVCSPAFPCVFHFHTTYPVSLRWPLGYEIASATKIVKKEEVFVCHPNVSPVYGIVWSSKACVPLCWCMLNLGLYQDRNGIAPSCHGNSYYGTNNITITIEIQKKNPFTNCPAAFSFWYNLFS